MTDPSDQDARDWVMPWERQPSWLYLPHLLDRAEDSQRDRVEERPPEGESSRSSTDGNVDMGRELQVHAAEDATRGSKTGVGSAGHAIRGQRDVPGTEGMASRSREVGGAAPAPTQIRGPLTEPGARSGRGGATATPQQRLNARNAHLSISLAQHADRVRKRQQECLNEEVGPTPAERVAALRRRIAEKSLRSQAHDDAGRVDGDSGSSHGVGAISRAVPTSWSNEDPHKIHLCMDSEENVARIHDGTAGGGGRGGRHKGAGNRNATLVSAACGDGRCAGDGNNADRAVTAADWAAVQVAWHTSSLGQGAG